jgi:hypothetical protein
MGFKNDARGNNYIQATLISSRFACARAAAQRLVIVVAPERHVCLLFRLYRFALNSKAEHQRLDGLSTMRVSRLKPLNLYCIL